MDENSSWKEDLLWLLEIISYGIHSLRISWDKHTAFYLDETWVCQNHLRNTLGRTHGEMKNWKFLTVGDAGSAKTGFVSSSKLTFSHMWGSDYNLEINTDSFKDDFLNRFRNYLDEESITIINSASYHSTITVRVRNTGFYKRDITEWLQKNYIEYNPTETIP
jgi:hypothetical protein